LIEMGGPVFYSQMPSPVGELMLVATDEGLCGVYMQKQMYWDGLQPDWRRDDKRLREARAQLRGYFAEELRQFELPLAPEGTEFQRTVWAELRNIPYGETISYGELAGRIGRPNASRAVGLANGRNPLSIIVPCHRVVGSDGSLTGYGGGLARKRWLLDHERGVPRSWLVLNSVDSISDTSTPPEFLEESSEEDEDAA
jgi:methylated-DNA-[protein]-cysteine S-methyltransferase